MNVPFNDLSRRLSGLHNLILNKLETSLQKADFVLGVSVSSFENEFAEFIGSKFATGVNSGTDALTLSLRSLMLSSKSPIKVGTTANAGGYATIAALLNRLEIHFVDVDNNSLQINLEGVKDLAARGCNVIVVTHLYGYANPEIEQIAEFCQRKKLFLIEDCAQAHGVHVKGRHVGTYGDISTFSFYPTKNLGGIGDGGAVLTNSSEIYDKVKSLRNYGWGEKYGVELQGGTNSRLDSIQAEVLSILIPYLSEQNVQRQKIATRYRSEIKNTSIRLLPFTAENHNGHIFPIMSPKRPFIQRKLSEAGIETAIHYPIPDYKQRAWRDNYRVAPSLPVTEMACSEILSLPIFPGMNDFEIDYVIETINSISSE